MGGENSKHGEPQAPEKTLNEWLDDSGIGGVEFTPNAQYEKGNVLLFLSPEERLRLGLVVDVQIAEVDGEFAYTLFDLLNGETLEGATVRILGRVHDDTAERAKEYAYDNGVGWR